MTTVAESPGTIPAELMDAAMSLPPEVRREMAERLLASLHTPAPLIPEWKAEIARRLKADDAGLMKGYTLEETAAYLQKVVDEGGGS